MNFNETINKEFGLNENISNVVLIFLLFARLADNYLAVWIFGANTPDWFRYWYSGIAYILTALIIWLNKHRLATLHIDRPFISIFIISGVLYALFLKYGVGIFVGITAGLIFLAYQTNRLVFSKPVPFSKGTGLLIFLTILLALTPALLFWPALKSTFDFDIFITTFQQILITDLAAIVFEEVLFRGALWAYVRSLGFSERSAFYITAICFWISHYRFLALSTLYVFWISIPILALLLGLMILHSKSLTPSTISHLLFNFLNQFLITSLVL